MISGSASIQKIHQNHLEIKTSHQTIINWKDFSIAPKEIVQFIQPSSSSAVLNRVKGNESSQILGQLIANGESISSIPMESSLEKMQSSKQLIF